MMFYLDYLKNCNLTFYESYDEFLIKKSQSRLILLTTKSEINYTKFAYKKNDTLIFGRESAGVPEKYTII